MDIDILMRNNGVSLLHLTMKDDKTIGQLHGLGEAAVIIGGAVYGSK